jgi:hypothetical protein
MQPIVFAFVPGIGQPLIDRMSLMTKHVRHIVAGGLSLILVAVASIAGSQAQGASIKDQLVGQWQLVSVGINGTAPYGANPQGSMLLDSNGHYALIVISDGGARNISYYGTYTADDAAKTVTMHITGGTRANAAGRDQTRAVSFNGDQLIESTPAGHRGSITLTWKRVN